MVPSPQGAEPTPEMFVRITRQLTGSVDGIQLRRFRPGLVYQVGTVIASYLFAEGAAEIAPPGTDAFVLPPDRHLFGPLPELPLPKPSLTIANPFVDRVRVDPFERSQAADRPRPRRRKRSRSAKK